MKDRMALAMIEGAEQDGLLEQGTTVVEYSGGSTGPALALICSLKGYRCIIVIADSHTEERLQLMRALGAELEIVPSVEGAPRVTAEDIRRMVERAGELAALPGHYATDQFNNPYIVAGFRDTLGREIWEQTEGRVTAFCHGVGTAGSLMGIAQALKPHGVRICALEPAGSAALTGGPRGPFATQGWTGIVPPLWDPGWVDEIQQIEDHDAIEMTRRLAREEGIFGGITTGANVVGALRLAERLGSEAVVVTLAVDTGFKYLTVAPFGQPTYATGVVGREEELAAVDAFLTAAPAAPQALLLEGEAGMGKTMLWQAAVRGARERSYAVLEYRPADAEARRSFSGLEALFSAHADLLGSLPPPQGRALEVAFRVCEPGTSPPRAQAIGLGVLGILRLLASTQTVVLAIDDVELLDAASAAAITFALRRLEGEPVSLIAAREPSGSTALRLDRFVRQPVGPLSLGALHRVLQDRLETVFPRRQIVGMHRVSAGNPFFALELARAHLPLFGAEEPPAPRQLEELIRGRVEALSSDVREALFDLAALSHVSVDRCDLDRLGPAIDAAVVEVEDGDVRFSHRLVADGVSAYATPAQRRDAHARTADLVDDPEERARHLALAADGPSSEVASALEGAARDASARGAAQAAAELAGLAVSSTPEGDSGVVRRMLLVAESLITVGEAGQAEQVLQRLVQDVAPGSERASARLLLSRIQAVDLDAASELCTRALVDAGDDQKLRAEINARAASLSHARGGLARALAHARAAREAAETTGDAPLLVYVLSLVAQLETVAADTVDDHVLDLALELESENERPAGLYAPRIALGLRLLYAGKLDRARAALEEDHVATRASGDDAGRAWVLAQLAGVELHTGRHEEARRYTHEALVLAEQERTPQLRAAVAAVAARVSAHAGELEEARAAALRGEALSAEIGAKLQRLENAAARGYAELSCGDTSEADRLLRPLLEEAAQMGFAEPAAAPFVADAIEAMIESGAVEGAQLHVEALERRAHERPSPWTRHASLRIRGLWLAGTGRLEEAEAALREAVRENGASTAPLERARALLALGITLRRGKQKRAARETIEDAAALFEQIGATAWARRARDELARIAGRRRVSTALTPTEQRVADLVAEGRSNKEVAAALHVTVKTVEGTLSRVYAKLGVRSRTALARQLSEESGRADSWPRETQRGVSRVSRDPGA